MKCILLTKKKQKTLTFGTIKMSQWVTCTREPVISFKKDTCSCSKYLGINTRGPQCTCTLVSLQVVKCCLISNCVVLGPFLQAFLSGLPSGRTNCLPLQVYVLVNVNMSLCWFMITSTSVKVWTKNKFVYFCPFVDHDELELTYGKHTQLCLFPASP